MLVVIDPDVVGIFATQVRVGMCAQSNVNSTVC